MCTGESKYKQIQYNYKAHSKERKVSKTYLRVTSVYKFLIFGIQVLYFIPICFFSNFFFRFLKKQQYSVKLQSSISSIFETGHGTLFNISDIQVKNKFIIKC